MAKSYFLNVMGTSIYKFPLYTGVSLSVHIDDEVALLLVQWEPRYPYTKGCTDKLSTDNESSRVSLVYGLPFETFESI